MLKFLLIFIPLFIAFLAYNLEKLLDLTKQTNFHSYESCTRIPLEMPTEDLESFGEYLIGAPSDLDSVFNKHFAAASMIPGYLISYHKKTGKVSKIPIKNFPDKFQLNPHGIDLYNNRTLYVLSHSYEKGGELVFAFDLSFEKEIVATFINYISLGNDHGIYNSIAFVDSQNFYITQWCPFPDPKQGRDNSFLTGLYRTFLISYTQTGGVKHCIVSGNTADCSFKLRGNMPNGILYEDETLYMTDTALAAVNIYKVDKNFELIKVDSLKLTHGTDNLSFRDGVVYTSGANKGIDLHLHQYAMMEGRGKHFVPGGISKVYKENGKWTSQEIIMQELISLPTCAVADEDQIVISSIADPALLVCSLR